MERNRDSETVDTTPRQILSFMLDGDSFGVEISGIQEVLEYRDVTRVPRTPDYMLGVLNLRGRVIPVVDLRRLFGMQIAPVSVETCIVIIDVELDGKRTPLGVLADRVNEVVELDPALISPPPRLGARIKSSFIDGLARHEDDFIILLRLALIFSRDELETVLHESAVDERRASADAEEVSV
ncbi:chemotaxis protein CheW [Marinobacterium iners]|uniref:chemotaxis protein CheW n=1 Tax=Marinobacterium iners TaxID=48076 RepID=UPI001A8E401B|nr:chemotaxis protein CheW [Marinobacterium iners]QSR34615.1 chemotaxis protein CheW [Marinobacterium iners]